MDAHSQPYDQVRITFADSLILRHLPDRVTVTDRNGFIVHVNPAFEEVTGYTAEEAIGQRPSLLKSGVHPPEFYEELWRTITSGHPFRAEVANRKKNGELYFEDQLIVPIFDAECGQSDEPCGFVSIARDLSDRKQLEARILHLAEHDELTGLPNRRGLISRAERALVRATELGEPLTLLFIDLDDFKVINDAYGHRVGDLALAAAACKIRGGVREKDICGRWGGDEFVVILPGTDLKAAWSVAQRIRKELDTPTHVDDKTPIINLKASIGMAIFPSDGRSVDELIRIADSGMYRAKERAGGIAHTRDWAQVEYRLRRSLELSNALRLNQLHLHYQPILDLGSGTFTKAEALLRWRHPRTGTIRPGNFVALAEQSREIVAIDQWVAREAIKTIRWLSRSGIALDICINVSGRTLGEGALSDLITQFDESESEYLRHLIVEVTERAVFQLGRAQEAVDALRKRGVRIAIDDFGTGYSGLAYLEDLSADIVKIDQRFIKGLGCNRGSEAIVGAVIGLASEFGCRSLAEGVETATQLKWLTEAGCHEAQGYLIGRPMPRERLARIATSHFGDSRPVKALG